MKPISIFTAFGSLLLFTVLLACKKDKIDPAPDANKQLVADAEFNNSIVAGLGNVFIQQTFRADTRSLLVAKLAFNQDTVAIYGKINSASQLENPHTIVLAKNNELLVTEVFDETMTTRTYMMVNNVKSNFVTEIKHYNANTKELSILDFDHHTGTYEIIWSAIVENQIVRPMSKTAGRGKIMAVATGFSDAAMCGTPAPTDKLDKELDKVLKYFACGGAVMDAHLVTSVIMNAFNSGFEYVKSLNQYLAKEEQIELTRKAMERQDDFYRKTNATNWDEVKSTKEALNSDLKEIEKIRAQDTPKDKRDIALGILNETTTLHYDEYNGKKMEFSISAVDLNTGGNGSPLIVVLKLTDVESGATVYHELASVKRQSGTADFIFDPLTMNDYRKVKGLVARYSFTLNGVEKSYTRAITLKFIGPEEVSAVSGNGQPAEPGKKLASPLKVKVLDAKGQPVKDAIVEWIVTSGGGKVDSPQSLSQADGTAEMGWTVGLTGTQLVEAKVKKHDGTPVSGSPVTFSVGVSIVGRWNLLTRSYRDSSTPLEVDQYAGKGSFLELRSDNTYAVSFDGEGGTGTFGFANNTVGFQLLSGDDDLTDGEIYTVKKLTPTELILEDRSADSVYEIKLSR